MKKLLVLAGLCAALQTSAQYSQWIYGPGATFNQASNGHIARSTGDGHLMAGPHTNGSAGSAYVVRNNVTGDATPGPYFNNNYFIIGSSGALEVRECKIIEFNHYGYGLAGVCYDPSNMLYSVFYQPLDGVGAPLALPSTYYPAINPYVQDISFGNIQKSANGHAFYIVGSVKMSNTSSWRPFVIKTDYLGVITWSHVYDDWNAPSADWKAFDIAENAEGNTLAVVGTYNGSVSTDGALFLVNASDGLFAAPLSIYGTNQVEDELLSVTYSRATAGWMVSGRSNVQAWMMGLDAGGSVNWSVLNSNDASVANQIIERRNTLGDYEYYTAGTMDNGPLGARDVQVHKGDALTGNISAQFIYGGSLDDYGYGLAANNDTWGQGLAVFGATESFAMFGTRNTYFIKAYFNGLSGCNEYFSSVDPARGPGLLTMRDFVSQDNMTPFGDNNVDIQPGEQRMLCYSDQIDGGDNSLKVQVKDAGLTTQDKQMVLVSPNPVSATSDIRLNVTAPAGTIEVIVADYMGREYINQRFDIREGGEQTLSVELNKANLTPGLYLLKVNGLDKPATQVLVVK